MGGEGGKITAFIKVQSIGPISELLHMQKNSLISDLLAKSSLACPLIGHVQGCVPKSITRHQNRTSVHEVQTPVSITLKQSIIHNHNK